MLEKNKKQLIIFTSVTLSILAFLFISPEDIETNQNHKILGEKEEINHHPPTRSGRHVASITPIQKNHMINKKSERQLIGQNIPPKYFSNNVNPKWEETYRKRFLHMAGPENIKGLKILPKRSIIKIENNIGTYLEHIVVSYTSKDGKPFSFEAMIDSETGFPVQTWNQTRYEKKEKILINAEKYKFQANEN